MDKSKLLAIGLLAVLGGGMFFAQQNSAQNTPTAVPHDHDGDGKPDHADHPEHEENAQPASAEKPTAPEKPGPVKTLPGGLKIQDFRQGAGKEAKSGDTLVMNYKGQLTNGKVFDQSYGREPFTFQIGAGQVIKGWDQGIVGMKEGGKRKLTIPASLGYGDAGAGADIPPGATLIFEVELIEVR